MCINCLGVPDGTYTDENHKKRDELLWDRIQFYANLNRETVKARQEMGVPTTFLEAYVKEHEQEYFKRKGNL